MAELPDKLPRHVAIIMDGNGRWARRRGLPRMKGHEAGFQSARSIAECCVDWEIPALTFYAFSTENWKRPRREVNFLMSRLEKFCTDRRDEFADKGVALRIIGRRDELPESLQRELEETIECTRRGEKLTLVLALNYGSRQEIVRAVRTLARKAREGKLQPEDIDEELLGRHLDTAGLPEPDLLIRTGGEQRLSNFLLWQLWYAEIYWTETFWPDFGREEFLAALREYARRERRFGGLPESAATGEPVEEGRPR